MAETYDIEELQRHVSSWHCSLFQGLTFTAATVVVFAEMYWTPGMMVQCEDRAHRIGQTSCVAVHYLVAKDTMDEWVWSAVCKKVGTVKFLNFQMQVTLLAVIDLKFKQRDQT